MVDINDSSATSILLKYPDLLNGGADESNVTALQVIAAFGKTEMFDYKKWSNYIKNDTKYINRDNHFGNTALHYALYNGNIKLIEWLTNNGVELNEPIVLLSQTRPDNRISLITYLQERVQNICGTYLHLAVMGGNLKSVQYLLDHKAHTNFGLAEAAFTSAEEGRRDCLALLLKFGADISFKNADNQTTIDVIFSNISRPAIFITNVLDQQITYDKSSHKIDSVKLDFSLLKSDVPHITQEMDIFSELLNAADGTEKIILLQHPITETFLKLKWAKVRPFFYTQIVIYSGFVLSLSVHVMQLIDNFSGYSLLIKYFLIITGIESFIHAFLQLILTPGNKWAQYEMWMNLLCTTLSLIIAIKAEELNPNEYYNKTPTWILHVTSIAVLLAWTELMLLIGRLPIYGYYAIMFTAVLQNVIKVLLTFLCLVIGFALSFSIQFHTLYQFRNPWLSFVKTCVMMMGEFEYSDLFNSIDEDKPNFRLPATSRVIFGLFVILVSIVLMNLMVGLAVNDIQGLQQVGHAKRHLKQAEFLRQVEKVALFIENAKWTPMVFKEILKEQIKLDSNFYEFNFMCKSKNKANKGFTTEYIDSIYTYARNLNQAREIKLDDLIETIKILFKNNEKIL